MEGTPGQNTSYVLYYSSAIFVGAVIAYFFFKRSSEPGKRSGSIGDDLVREKGKVTPPASPTRTAAKVLSNTSATPTPERKTLKVLPDPVSSSLIVDTYGIAEAQGTRESMEDATFVKVSDNYSLFGVFDGHGGAQAAKFLGDKYHELLMDQACFKTDPKEAMRLAVLAAESAWCTKGMEEKLLDGSTLVAALVMDKKLYVANVGDSELVVSRNGQAEVITVQHNPSKNEDEIRRIEDAGGRLHRKRIGHPFLNKQFFNLGVSRAIGDLMYKSEEYTHGKESGLIADPDLQVVPLDGIDCFVIACDGLWDVVSYQDAVDFVRTKRANGKSATEIANSLVEKALEDGSRDNVSLGVVFIR